ncbi:acyltransferase [Methylomonas sp. Kb3]|uniref:acyltransferase family protein n=1 Tax=Methylomonas sp. Kb3 TaxID=1611544 RepID=UPI0013FDB3F9|nr:acyltransferase [Methylomonas sp. Kb3]
MAKNQHILLIDGYRFLAAISVVCFHYFADVNSAQTRFNVLYGKIFEFPHLAFFEYGRFGVDLFFLISGFVIALSAEGRSFSGFLASRVARIVPTYWLAIILTSAVILIFQYQPLSLRQLFANLAFLQRPLGESFIDGVYWTIAIEFRFYLLVAVLILFKVYRFYHWLLLGWVVLCFVDYYGVNIGWIKQLFITSYGYYFSAGGAFYHIYQERHRMLSVMTVVLSFCLAVLVGVDRFKELTDIGVGCVIFVCYGLMWLISSKRFDDIKCNSLVVAGAVTYPLYLLHLKIGNILMKHLTITASGILLNIIIMVGMLLLSWVVSRYFEKSVNPAVRRGLEALLSGLHQSASRLLKPAN